MGYVILSDSTCSLNSETINECGIEILPLSFIINGKEYSGDTEENLKFFYDQLRKRESASTSCINIQRFINEFEKRLKEGLDIIYLSLSSGISATYQNAVSASLELKGDYPDRRIVVIDTLSASSGEGLLAYSAGMLKKSGKSFDEVIDWVEEWKYKTSHLFTVDDLFFLYRGGRVKPTAYLAASVLKVKPLMHIPNDGSLQPYGKVIGRKRSITSIVNKIAEKIVDSENQTIFICHGDCMDDVEFAIDTINTMIKVKDIKVFYTDPVIGTHSGPGTLAFFFFSNERA